MQKEGKKNDKKDDKTRWELMPLDCLEDIARVYTEGAKKYGENTWQNLENGYQRYKAALLRHLWEFEKGNEIDPETGYVMDVKFLTDIIKSEVEEQMDHKNLNLDVPEFENLNPTAENIVVVIWNKIRAKIKSSLDLEVVLYETPRNFVTYRGE